MQNLSYFCIRNFDPRGNELTGPVRLWRRIFIKIQKSYCRNLRRSRWTKNWRFFMSNHLKNGETRFGFFCFWNWNLIRNWHVLKNFSGDLWVFRHVEEYGHKKFNLRKLFSERSYRNQNPPFLTPKRPEFPTLTHHAPHWPASINKKILIRSSLAPSLTGILINKNIDISPHFQMHYLKIVTPNSGWLKNITW